jgi:hypothetical protein
VSLATILSVRCNAKEEKEKEIAYMIEKRMRKPGVLQGKDCASYAEFKGTHL